MAVAVTPAELVTALAKNDIFISTEQAECALVDVILARAEAEPKGVQDVIVEHLPVKRGYPTGPQSTRHLEAWRKTNIV